MNPSNLTYPEHLVQPSEPKVRLYEKLVWHNSEVCNNCFQRIRTVGDVVEKRTDLFVHEQNSEYDRTDLGSQEFDPFTTPADRYGQCYCLDCGADTRATRDTLSLDEMRNRGANLVRYVAKHTDRAIDGRAVGRAIKDLKAIHDNGGYDSEIFCVAAIHGIERAEQAKSGRKVTA